MGSHVTAPGEQLGVRCLAQGPDTPPTNNPCRTWDSNPQPSAYKSDSLSIRPRLPLYLWYHKNKSEKNLNGWQVGRTLGWGLHVSKSKPLLVFLYHCISDGNQKFSENFGCHFHFILHVCLIKQRLWEELWLCVQRYREPRSLPLQQRLPAGRELFAYNATTNSVSTVGL